MKLYVTLLIKAVTECVKGDENFWTRGKGVGAKNFPNQERYIPKHETKAYLHVFPLIWTTKEY